MNGKIIGGTIVLAGAIAGAAMYYLQVYGFYEEVPASGGADVVLTSVARGVPEPILHENFRAIDAESSPIRYRACFDTPVSIPTLTETFVIVDDAVPLNAPGWFDCFDAAALGDALEEGTAIAFLGAANVTYGIDRIVAITADGHGYAWHQINACGKEVFDGKPTPESCPPAPERTE